MHPNRLFNSKEQNLSCKFDELLEQQTTEWEFCKNGYATLNTIKVHSFNFDGYTIKVQFNPGRLTSSSAKVDPKTIKERKCFLCEAHLPDDQKGIVYKDDYLILVNPFPIFPKHFTIPALGHIPQKIQGNFGTMLALTEEISRGYLVFYNGPKCGASAPDHFHFQAGNKNFLPIEYEYESIKEKYADEIFNNGDVSVYTVDDGLRKMLFVEGNVKEQIGDVLEKFYINYADEAEEEPLLNIVSEYDPSRGFRVIIFLREKHRPTQFFAEGDDKILLSPASVDIGGVAIVPIEHDFLKVNKEVLTDIFSQVFISSEKLKSIKI